MNKRTALLAALLATTMAASPAWSQSAGGSAGATSGSGSTTPDAGSSNRPGGAATEDNSGRGLNQPGNRGGADTTRPGSTATPEATRPAPIQTPAAPAPRAGGMDISSLHEITKDQENATYNGMTAKNLEDMNIVNPAGKKVGEIDKVLATSDNKVVAVVVDAGGILGIGGDKVVVPLDQLTLDSKGKQFVASMDENQLKAMPKWNGQARK
jgi:sporulation protein YlmC with PRC-barrel domain